MSRFTLKGSERAPLPGARAVAPADPKEPVEVCVLIRRRSQQALQDRVSRLSRADRSLGHLSRDEFARQFAADSGDIAAVKTFAAQHGLRVVQEHAARRTVTLSGTVAQMEAAFGVTLKRYQHPRGSYRGREGAIQLPAELSGIVEAVLGLDNRPQAQPHFRVLRHARANPVAYTPTQIATLYGFPDSTGQGQCVGIIELGGGFKPADLQTYFSNLGVGAPQVTAVSVDGAQNAPTGSADGPDGEVMLDIEVIGAIAPGSKIVVYFAPNTDAGFLDALTTAIHDTTNKPSVLSISWGSSESTWTAQSMTAMDEAFQEAATLGITVCVASGDSGSSDGVSDGNDHVDFPASSPYALACGGTSLRATATSITSEVVWNDSAQGGGSGGGGVSSFFAVPTWQTDLKVTKAGGTTSPLANRGVPDVAGDADPQTGYDVRIDGSNTVLGGTSAVAPLWAGLLARVNALTGKSVGLIQPQLYRNPQALRDITKGNNGDFFAAVGWDACTGLGTPKGGEVATVFSGGD
ncbi:MAG TPA: S53 family peptidase [Steroidobacteraceae bacterium]|nr:S53 family peptidase [Steroidobacteraceae bacterium]